MGKWEVNDGKREMGNVVLATDNTPDKDAHSDLSILYFLVL